MCVSEGFCSPSRAPTAYRPTQPTFPASCGLGRRKHASSSCFHTHLLLLAGLTSCRCSPPRRSTTWPRELNACTLLNINQCCSGCCDPPTHTHTHTHAHTHTRTHTHARTHAHTRAHTHTHTHTPPPAAPPSSPQAPPPTHTRTRTHSHTHAQTTTAPCLHQGMERVERKQSRARSTWRSSRTTARLLTSMESAPRSSSLGRSMATRGLGPQPRSSLPSCLCRTTCKPP
jgi:hypothetical protein